MNAETKLQRARIALLLDEPFFGSLLLGLKSSQDKSGMVPTMATDGLSLLWSEKFVEELEPGELKTVLCHEVLHVAYLHQLRRGQRDSQAWNQAADHAINLVLEDYNEQCRASGRAAPFPWPKCGALKDPQYKGMSAEEIYSKMPKGGGSGQGQGKGSGQKGNGQPQPGDQPGMGDVLDAPGDQASQDEQETTWKVALVQAATAAKMQGKLPASMARLVEDMLNPKQRWQDILRDFVQARANDDYDWSKPNRRYLQSGFILPSLYSQRLGPIAVAIDTSGSIDQAILNEFMGEVEGIAHECRPEKIILIDCDARVNSVRTFEPYEPLPRDFTGGGGTDHSVIWPELENHSPLCCICFTDLYTSFGDDPGVPVLWASSTKGITPPFGQLVEI